MKTSPLLCSVFGKNPNKKNPEKYIYRFLGLLISNPRSIYLHNIRFKATWRSECKKPDEKIQQNTYTRRKMDIQLCDKHLIYSVLISRYWNRLIWISLIILQLNIYRYFNWIYMRWLSHSWISKYWSWISIFLRVYTEKKVS